MAKARLGGPGGAAHLRASAAVERTLEADSVHELIRKVEDIAPELVELNRQEIAATA